MDHRVHDKLFELSEVQVVLDTAFLFVQKWFRQTRNTDSHCSRR